MRVALATTVQFTQYTVAAGMPQLADDADADALRRRRRRSSRYEDCSETRRYLQHCTSVRELNV